MRRDENRWNGWKVRISIKVDQIDKYGGQGIKMDEMDRTYLNRWQLTNVDRILEDTRSQGALLGPDF